MLSVFDLDDLEATLDAGFTPLSVSRGGSIPNPNKILRTAVRVRDVWDYSSAAFLFLLVKQWVHDPQNQSSEN